MDRIRYLLQNIKLLYLYGFFNIQQLCIVTKILKNFIFGIKQRTFFMAYLFSHSIQRITSFTTLEALNSFSDLERTIFFTGFPLKEQKVRIPMVDPREQHHPSELPLLFCGYLCIIYEKCSSSTYIRGINLGQWFAYLAMCRCKHSRMLSVIREQLHREPSASDIYIVMSKDRRIVRLFTYDNRSYSLFEKKIDDSK